MECLSVQKLPTGAKWTYEVKLDGFRMEALRLPDRAVLYSRHGKLMTPQFSEIAKELEHLLPPGTTIDGELAALDDQGHPSFNLLQNFRSDAAHLAYFVFDMLVYMERDVTRLPLSERRALLHGMFESGDYVHITEWTTDLEGIENFVRERRLEGIIAKRADSRYEVGKRSGSWVKMRITNRQEFVIGGYTPSYLGLDALLVGVYKGKELHFAGSVRGGLTPQTRREVHDQIKSLEIVQCPFVNLPDTT
jgi:bifunctional non-homologous end joining protein LigD